LIFRNPFAVTVLISLALIFAYTYRGGLKPSSSLILYKHFLSHFSFMTIYFICQSLNLNTIRSLKPLKTVIILRYFLRHFLSSKFHFVKQILGGIFVTIAMVGLDQDLMQKNLSCATIGEAQRMFAFHRNICPNQYLLLSVGALIYAAKRN
jgi:hypothetical protein